MDRWKQEGVALIPDDTDFAVGFVEFHPALGQGKQGEIPSHAHIFARPVLSASLANDNVSRNDVFSAVFFDPQHFRVAVATVLGGALSFFMSHDQGDVMDSILMTEISWRCPRLRS